ncbi:hypothetical protein [Janthinobacterium sp. HLX7-2]|uniref:hypothetical protein n=1 Tax=Janthinobacterium sp. HLX7-2 TaxID=1259331 RepID=UPI003F234ED5
MGFFDFFRARPTPDGFAHAVLRQVRQRHPARQCLYEAQPFRIVFGSDAQQIFNLDHAYRDYCAAPRKLRTQVLQNHLAGIDVPALPASFAEAREHLMPMIRSRSQGDYLRLLALQQPPRPALADAWRALDDDALILLAHDTASSMATIGQATLAQWGVTFEQALAAAMDNLRARTPHSFLALGDGLLMGEWHDAYDSSRLLLPDLLYRACQGGEPLVMIPTRGRFLLASSHNVAGQLQMIALADKLMQDEGRQVSPAMYGVRNGKIVACQPADAAVAAALARLQAMLRAHHYGEQKQEWDQLNAQRGENVCVAACMLFQSKGGEREGVVSLATWTRGVDTLLPRTDIVAMVVPADNGGDSATKLLAWDDALAIGGELMQEVECYPVRYRVRGFPAPHALAAAPAWDS